MDDNQIIALFFQRNEDAIRQTDSVYGSRLFRISQNILRCQEDAQECVSDTYLRAWNAIPPTRPNSLFAFLARVCRNLSLTRLDWAMASKRKAEIVALTQEMEQCIPDSRRDNSMEAKELGRLLNAFLETQSRENQMVFVRAWKRRNWAGFSMHSWKPSPGKIRWYLSDGTGSGTPQKKLPPGTASRKGR